MKTTTNSKRAYIAPKLVNLGEVKNLTKNTKGSSGGDNAPSPTHRESGPVGG